MNFPLDYRLLQALAAVVEEGGFERAARRLFITQSAVSQRLRLLEDQIGSALLVRSKPPAATDIGQRLLSHYKQVEHLENALRHSLLPEQEGQALTVKIAVNADSLATWLLGALGSILREGRLLLDISLADQDETHSLLRNGKVLGCISSRQQPIQGCSSVALGTMSYRCMASPAFRDRWFPKGLTSDAARLAPVVTYDRTDGLQARFLQGLGLGQGDYPTHYLPDSHMFCAFCLQGFGYGFLPLLQVQQDLKAGRLVELCPGEEVLLPLYWHYWNLGTDLMQQIAEALCQHSLY